VIFGRGRLELGPKRSDTVELAREGRGVRGLLRRSTGAEASSAALVADMAGDEDRSVSESKRESSSAGLGARMTGGENGSSLSGSDSDSESDESTLGKRLI
jgi:hypothetical protein